MLFKFACKNMMYNYNHITSIWTEKKVNSMPQCTCAIAIVSFKITAHVLEVIQLDVVVGVTKACSC